MIYYGDALIHATHFTKKRVTYSSTESKFVAVSDGGRHMAWLGQFCQGLYVTQLATAVYQDNSGSVG